MPPFWVSLIKWKMQCSYVTFWVTPDIHSFPRTFAHIWSNWDSIFVMLSLNYDFNFNLSIKSNNSCLFLPWLLSFKMLTLKSPIMMIGQCLRKCWIIIWSLFTNVKIEDEWAPYTHTICLAFHVLILKLLLCILNYH